MLKRLVLFLFLILLPAANSQNIAIIGAMDCEISQIQKNLINQKVKNGVCFGKIGKNKIILLKSGVGKVNAAIALQKAIDKYKPDFIINTGLAGALDKSLKKGDIVLADKLVQHDFDNSALGYAKGYMSDGNNPIYPTYYFTDENLRIQFQKEFQKTSKVRTGLIASGDTFVASLKKKEEIKKEFGAIALDMESAAIAQCANKNGVSLVVVRLISDEYNDKIKDYVEQNEEKYAQQSAQNLVNILKYITVK